MTIQKDNALGSFLKSRRAKLDPAAFGFSTRRRRTPGLRREEVAQRAHISATWYTWLEQGRGGAPSERALEQIAKALVLTDAEREHLFLLTFGRPPKTRYHTVDSVTPRLQRVLDALEYSPALIKTAAWDVVAWNRSAAAVLTDYAALPDNERNILRIMFCSPAVRARQSNRESVARYVVETFRADVIRAGAEQEVEALVDELCRRSSEFKALWQDDSSVRNEYGGSKRLNHPDCGPLDLEFSNFAVNGRADLSLMIFNPATPADTTRIRSLLERGT